MSGTVLFLYWLVCSIYLTSHNGTMHTAFRNDELVVQHRFYSRSNPKPATQRAIRMLLCVEC